MLSRKGPTNRWRTVLKTELMNCSSNALAKFQSYRSIWRRREHEKCFLKSRRMKFDFILFLYHRDTQLSAEYLYISTRRFLVIFISFHSLSFIKNPSSIRQRVISFLIAQLWHRASHNFCYIVAGNKTYQITNTRIKRTVTLAESVEIWTI